MAYDIGVNVLESDGRAAPTIVAAPISVAGFLIRSERGPADLPVALRGLTDYSRTFGGFTPGLFGPHAIRGFFDNGGTDAYAVRILGEGASAARTVLVDDRGAETLQVRAGSRGLPDCGRWGRSLAVEIVDHPRAETALPAQVRGSRAEPFGIAEGAVLTVHLGHADVSVPFRETDFAIPGAASAAEVVAVIGRRTTAFRAAHDVSGHLVLAAPSSGPVRWLDVSGTAAAALGFEEVGPSDPLPPVPVSATVAAVDSVGGLTAGSLVRVATRGVVVARERIAESLDADADAEAGIRVTVDGAADAIEVRVHAGDFAGPDKVVQALNRQAVDAGFTAALTADGRLVLRSNTVGDGSTVLVGEGTPDARGALGLEEVQAVAGVTTLRTLTAVDESARLVTWAEPLESVLLADAGRLRTAEFDLVVRRGETELERFESLSRQPDLDHSVFAVVNDTDVGSRYVVVGQPAGGAASGGVPEPGLFPLADEGSDGGDPVDMSFIGDPAERTGLYAFDTVDVQLLACPDSTSAGVVSACLGYVERRGDAMFVGTTPAGLDRDGAKTYAAPFRARKVYGALYAPWIDVVNPLDGTGTDPRVTVPPVGHVLGMYARVAQARGVWKAPAGDEAMLVSALGVEFDLTEADHTDLVRNGGVNGVRAIPGVGIVVDASRTLSTDTRWTFVNVRRLFNFVKASLRDGLRWVPQEPHSEDLRRRVKYNVITPFLLGLWRQGAFGSDPPDDVFTVKCDAENNPPDAVNLGEFRVEVFFYPVKPAETIVVMVGQQESGAAAAEA